MKCYHENSRSSFSKRKDTFGVLIHLFLLHQAAVSRQPSSLDSNKIKWPLMKLQFKPDDASVVHCCQHKVEVRIGFGSGSGSGLLGERALLVVRSWENYYLYESPHKDRNTVGECGLALVVELFCFPF